MSRLQELGARIDAREARIGVVGLGYVGLPLAIEFAKVGFPVTGFDVDGTKVESVQEGTSYIEDVPTEELARMRSEGRLDATTDLRKLGGCDVINVCVPTPLTKSRDPDVSHLAKALEDIRKVLRSGQLVILGSTTYPGTTHDLLMPMLESSGLRVGNDFSLAFAPERIDPGNRQFLLRQVPKVVGGETPLCAELAARVFGTIFDEVVTVSSSQAAEMVKLLENTFRAINIGLANEVALMADRLGLDVWEVFEAAATTPYGFMKFLPGPGLGGHCIPVDPTYLAWKMKSLNFPARFIELATEINGHMPEHVADKVQDLLNVDRIAVNGGQDPGAGGGVQAQCLGHARIAGPGRGSAARRQGGRDPDPRSPRARVPARRWHHLQERGPHGRPAGEHRHCGDHHGPRRRGLRPRGGKGPPGLRHPERHAERHRRPREDPQAMIPPPHE